MSELQEKVFSVVAEELNVEVDSVNMGSNFIVDLKADSLDVVELVMKLEETFGIEIPELISLKQDSLLNPGVLSHPLLMFV